MKNRIKDIYNEIDSIISDNPKLERMINERIKRDNSALFHGSLRTVEDCVKQSGIDYQIDGNYILIGKSLENYDEVKENELERALEDEAEQNRWMEQRENQFYKYYDGELNE